MTTNQYLSSNEVVRTLTSCVVISHGPLNGEQSEKESDSRRVPSRLVVEVREDVGSIVLVGSGDEESDDDSEDCSEINEDERFRNEC